MGLFSKTIQEMQRLRQRIKLIDNAKIKNPTAVICTDNRFFLIEPSSKIGQGANGTVYVAQEINKKTGELMQGAPKAVKLIYDDPAIFHDEFEITPPYVGMLPPIHEEIDDVSISILVMTYFGPQTLDQLIKNKTLSGQSRLQIALSLIAQLQQIHASGIVHADLKPHNIIVQESNGWYSAVIIDFGSACKENTDRSGQKYGTAPYMAPELGKYEATKWRAASDVFALAAILIELFGGNPFVSRETLSSTDKFAHSKPNYYQIPYDIKLEELQIEKNINPFPDVSLKTLFHELIKRMQDSDIERRPTTTDVLTFFNAWHTVSTSSITKEQFCNTEPEERKLITNCLAKMMQIAQQVNTQARHRASPVLFKETTAAAAADISDLAKAPANGN